MPMFSDPYIEALLVDEELADQVWEAWDTGLIPEQEAAWAWFLIQLAPLVPRIESHDLTFDD